jgi:hypothetical protein
MSWGFMDEKVLVMTECKWFSWNSDLNKYEVRIHGWKIPGKLLNANDLPEILIETNMRWKFMDEKFLVNDWMQMIFLKF